MDLVILSAITLFWLTQKQIKEAVQRRRDREYRRKKRSKFIKSIVIERYL